MSQVHLGEPSGSNLDSHNGLINDSAASASPDRTPRTPYSRQRTDTLPTHILKHSLKHARLDIPKLPKLQQRTVCLESMDSSPWTWPSSLCTHEPKVCEPCLGEYVRHAIKEGLTEILCPDMDCRKGMAHQDVDARVHGDEECVKRYNDLVAQRELEKDPNFVWCTNPRCGRGQIHSIGAISPLVGCHYCHKPTCFTHRVPWHYDLTCDQYSKQEENNASEAYIDKYMKRCPGAGCKRPIEKIEGCDHMTCRLPAGCGHEFCWVCLANYGPIRVEGNSKHNPGCSYHPEFIRDVESAARQNVRTRMIELLTQRRRGCVARTRTNSPSPPRRLEPADFDTEWPYPPRSHLTGVLVASRRPDTDSQIDIPPVPSVPLRTVTIPLSGTEASGSRPRTETRAHSPGIAPALGNGSQDLAPDPSVFKAGTAYSSPGQTHTPNPLRRNEVSGPSSIQRVQPQRSELYQPPPLPQPIQPRVPKSRFRHHCLPRRLISQTAATAQRDEQIRERLAREERSAPEQREPVERLLSSIPDFESEILLDFIGRR